MRNVFAFLFIFVLLPGVSVSKDFDNSQYTVDKPRYNDQLPQDSYKNLLSRYRQRYYRNSAVYDYNSYPHNLSDSIYSSDDPMLRTYYPQTDSGYDNNSYDTEGDSSGYVVPEGGYDVYDAHGNKIGYVRDGDIYDSQGKIIGHTTQKSGGGFTILDKLP
jgi:hypothetical protein